MFNPKTKSAMPTLTPDIFSLDNAVRAMICVYSSAVLWVASACVYKYCTDEPTPIIVRESVTVYSSPFSE